MQKLAITGFIFLMLIGSSISTLAGDLDFEYTDINNNSRNLEEFKGKPLLVDAFATWCEPCKIEIEHLKSIYSISRNQLTIISLSVSPNSDTVNKVKDFRNEFNALWEFGIDTNSKFSNTFKVIFIPSLYLFDDQGELIKVWEGVTDPQVISDEIENSLGLELGKVNYNAGDAFVDQLSRNNMFQLTSAFLIVILVYNALVPKSKIKKHSEPAV
ncbi:MAG: TlpA family protein disulfide reductase [Candidatus Heimdallarchaeota archaeon]|nr:TlpA family protein disulfide reductase [Candidatus Heimdallarchaeota archaeon]